MGRRCFRKGLPGPGLQGLPEGREKHWHQARGVRCPGTLGGEEPRPGQPRVPEGGGVGAGRGRAGGPSAARPVAYLPAPRLPAEAAAAMLLWG